MLTRRHALKAGGIAGLGMLTVWYEVAPDHAKASLRQAKWRLVG